MADTVNNSSFSSREAGQDGGVGVVLAGIARLTSIALSTKVTSRRSGTCAVFPHSRPGAPSDSLPPRQKIVADSDTLQDQPAYVAYSGRIAEARLGIISIEAPGSSFIVFRRCSYIMRSRCALRACSVISRVLGVFAYLGRSV